MERFDLHFRRIVSQYVSIWYAHNSLPGADWERERTNQLHSAHIILFLISPDFIGSRTHNEQEVLPAMERYAKGEVHIIPIVLSSINWDNTPFSKLIPLPIGGKPIDHASSPAQDGVFVEVVKGIERVIQEIRARSNDATASPPLGSGEPTNIDDPSMQIEQILQKFRGLRNQVANYVRLNGDKGFNLGSCAHQYDLLYGDTMMFLARYLPERAKSDAEGFIAIVQREVAVELHQRGGFSVVLARLVISPLAKLEKLTAQINACVATLELYQQKYFTPPKKL
jgi:hypothetical protein